MNHCVLGYASLFISSVLERNYRTKMGLKDAITLILKCINVLKKRFIINHSNYIVKIIDEKGSRALCFF
jgi:20S proteasome subunit beta 4